jgi:hypothetical protein
MGGRLRDAHLEGMLAAGTCVWREYRWWEHASGGEDGGGPAASVVGRATNGEDESGFRPKLFYFRCAMEDTRYRTRDT